MERGADSQRKRSFGEGGESACRFSVGLVIVVYQVMVTVQKRSARRGLDIKNLLGRDEGLYEKCVACAPGL